jgi:hypothetical protein
MRTVVAALVALAVVAATHAAVAQDASERDVEADFELVERIGTKKAYETFLSTHKTGPYAELVRQRLHQLDPNGITRQNWGDDTFIWELIKRDR